MRKMAITCCGAAWLILMCEMASAQVAEEAGEPWDPELVEVFAKLPVQDGGRIKPLETAAGVHLLRLNGKRSFRDEEGRKVEATAWLMDCLFRPDLAKQHRVFLVHDAALLDALDIAHEGKGRRARYSYTELAVGQDKLMALREKVAASGGARDRLEQQALHLAGNLEAFEGLIHFMDFAREALGPEGAGAWRELVGEGRYSDCLEHAQALLMAVAALSHDQEVIEGSGKGETGTRLGEVWPEGLKELDKAGRQQALANIKKWLDRMGVLAHGASALALLPPEVMKEERWDTPASLFERAFFAPEETGIPGRPVLDTLRALEKLGGVEPASTAFTEALRNFSRITIEQAVARGEYRHIALEVRYHRLDLIYRSLVLYGLAFLLYGFAWAIPRSRVLWGASLVALALPTLALCMAIVMRCVIRERPPATTMYETILLGTATACMLALASEWMQPRRVAGVAGALLGMAGLFAAYKHELREGADTMPSLVAVLDTNFWLATHVTTITMGYAAGLLGSAVSHAWLLGRIVRPRAWSGELSSHVSRLVYGLLSFGLVFTVLGTLLGGIWAAESWGRFWGWDPKENGALMIVLWGLAVSHAKLGGRIRDTGLHLASVVNGMVVAFSWWGVNLLGVGLHSYGRTQGVLQALLLFFALETAVLGMGIWGKGYGYYEDMKADHPAA